MILADTLSISINLLLVAHVVISLLLILVVLMQRPKQEGLGAAFGGGVTDQMFGAQTTNVLQKGTVYLGTLFVVLSLVLAILIGNKNNQAAISSPAAAADAVEEAPAVPDVVPDGGSIKDELGKDAEGGAAPADGDAAPADGDAAPAEGDAAPAEGDAAPAEGDAVAPISEETSEDKPE